jgi:hypothetical protein
VSGVLRRHRVTALLWMLAAALSGFTILRGIGPHDEGLMLQAAARIASGEWPYRDFWWNYGPGQPLVLAGLVKAFGPSLLGWRVLRVALDATVALLAYRLARREADRGLALLAWVAVAGAMAWPTGPGPNPAALALGMGGMLAARRRPLLAGGLCGAAVVFRPEIGMALALGAVLAVAPGARARARVAAAACLVAAAGFAPFALAGGGAMVDQATGFVSVQHLQRLPFPLAYDGPLRPNKLIEHFFPALLLAALSLAAVVSMLRRPPGRTLALAPLALAGALYLLGRADEFHLVPLSVALAPWLAVLAARERGRAVRWTLVAALTLIAVHGLERRAGQLLHPPALTELRVDVADGVRVAPAEARALERLVSYVRARVRPGAPVFVANPRFDRVRVGDPLLYVLLRRPNPTRYDVMQPGVVTTAAVQHEMVRSLARTRPALVVRWLDPTASAPEGSGADRSSGVRILDRWLAARYRPAARFGVYEVLAVR